MINNYQIDYQRHKDIIKKNLNNYADQYFKPQNYNNSCVFDSIERDE